jgi:hypothetical protein
VTGAAMMPRDMKEETMTKQASFETPKQADVDRFIAQAHRMRSEYVSRLVKSGFARLRDVFSKNRRLGHSSA